jgi:FolB domain-containing protein
MDKIIIKNLRVEGLLGIHQREQETPQPILINIVMSVDISGAAADDDIHQTVNYSTIAKQIASKVKSTHYYTVEALISALADLVLETGRVEEVWLRVEKTEAVSITDSVGVEITRRRK